MGTDRRKRGNALQIGRVILGGLFGRRRLHTGSGSGHSFLAGLGAFFGGLIVVTVVCLCLFGFLWFLYWALLPVVAVADVSDVSRVLTRPVPAWVVGLLVLWLWRLTRRIDTLKEGR